MSIRLHPTKGEGWWYIQYRPHGRKGKLISVPFKGTKMQAERKEMLLRAGVLDKAHIVRMPKSKFDPGDGPFVYFVQQGYHGPIKIGCTKTDVAQRICKLQTGNPTPLRLLAIIGKSSQQEEKALHAEFSSLRLYREWFHPESKLLNFIKEVKAGTLPMDLAEFFSSFNRTIDGLPSEKRGKIINALKAKNKKEFTLEVRNILKKNRGTTGDK